MRNHRYKIAFLIMCFTQVSYGQSVVGEEKIERILPEDSTIQNNMHYKNEIKSKEQQILEYQQEMMRLQDENEKLKHSNPIESPAVIGASLGEVEGNNRPTKPATTQRATTTRSAGGGGAYQSFAVSAEEEESLVVVPAGSWVRARILTGVQANSRFPYNLLMQLEYAYTGPNGAKIPLEGCLIIGGAVADLSIERVIISPHTLSCVRDSGEYIQRKIKGFVAGKDSSNGVSGVFDSKQSKVFLAAVLAGVVQGASKAYEIANTQTSIINDGNGGQSGLSNFTGNFRELALAKGAGDAANLVTTWYLNQAKSLLPTIHIGSGQDVWVVMTDSVDVPDLNSWNF